MKVIPLYSYLRIWLDNLNPRYRLFSRLFTRKSRQKYSMNIFDWDATDSKARSMRLSEEFILTDIRYKSNVAFPADYHYCICVMIIIIASISHIHCRDYSSPKINKFTCKQTHRARVRARMPLWSTKLCWCNYAKVSKKIKKHEVINNVI
jgi:hypothetical protein